MIRRVFIKGYKSLRDVDLKLNPLTVIVGANASGKSNLLDALGLLGKIVTSPTIAAAFDEHRGTPLEAFFVPSGGVEKLLENETLRFSLGVEIELANHVVQRIETQMRDGYGSSAPESNGSIANRHLRYEIEIEFSTLTGELRAPRESLVALGDDARQSKRTSGALLERIDLNHGLLRVENQANDFRRYPVEADRSVASTALYPPHHPSVAAFKKELEQWRFHHLRPDAMRQDSPLVSVDRLGADGSGLSGYLHTRKGNFPQSWSGISDALSMLVPAVKSIDTELSEEGMVRLAHKDAHTGNTFSSRVVSDGVLRVLGLFAVLDKTNSATTICVEEPESGIYPPRLDLIARLLDSAAFFPFPGHQKQIIVTTYSARLPEILNPRYISGDFERQAQSVLCWKDNGETKLESLATYKRYPLLTEMDPEYTLEDAILSGMGSG